MLFDDLELSKPILQAIANKGYKTPSPIQEKAIPAVLEGRDVMAAAQTGTGKTAGFVLPILELLTHGPRAGSNQARALILAPTRELAAQVGESILTYGKQLPLSSAVVFGGVKINPQMMKLRRGVDILVATPGRLLDLYSQNAVRFSNLEILVLDEADRMLDMGFIRDITRIIKLLPKRRQNLMFSATFNHGIKKLAKNLVHNPIEISVSPSNTTAETVEQWAYTVDKKDKATLLTKLILDGSWYQALVFTKTKHRANKLTKQLESKGIVAVAIHGNKSQGARTKALAAFKAGEVQILVATDIAARGLDIKQLPQVVNFDLPNVPEDYVHRIGRTGRAGLTGIAISLVSTDEADLLLSIERLIKKTLPRKVMQGFEPTQTVPATSSTQHQHTKKPKKPKKKSSHAKRYPTDNSNSSRPNKKRRATHGQQPKSGNLAQRSSQPKNGNVIQTAKQASSKRPKPDATQSRKTTPRRPRSQHKRSATTATGRGNSK